MKEIKTFDELIEIQDKKCRSAYLDDLGFLRYAFNVIDGLVFVIGAECHESLELFYMSRENYDKLSFNCRRYIGMYYGVY